MDDRKKIRNRLKERNVLLVGTGEDTRDFCREFSRMLQISGCLSWEEDTEFHVDGHAVCPVYSMEHFMREWVFDDKTFIVFCDGDDATIEDVLVKKGLRYGQDYLDADLVRCLLSEKKVAGFYGVCTQRAICDCLKLSGRMTEEYSLFYWLSYRTMTVREHEMFLLMSHSIGYSCLYFLPPGDGMFWNQ